MKRYYKPLLSFFMSGLIVLSLFVPAISVSAAEDFEYSAITLVPDGEISETGYLSEKWVDENGEDFEIADTDKNEKPIANNSASIPEKYSAVDLGYMTAIRDQKSTNSCWAFSAVAAAETSLIKQGLATTSDSFSDLSEAHLVWFTHKSLTTDVYDPTFGDGTNEGSPYTKGGYWLRSTYSLARGSGFALEKDYPYYADNTTKMGDYDEIDRYDRKISLDKAYQISNDQTDEIKQAIMENGSIMVAAGIYTTYLNKGPDGYAYYQNIAVGTNHQMIAVGWDDNFSVDNFREDCRPSSPGAWLVKNSYGTDFGDNGYFWISYEEPTLDQFVVEEVSIANENESIYQYDGYGYRSAMSKSMIINEIKYPVTTAKQANVFTASTNEMLSAVSFYTVQDDITYTIEIYNNVNPSQSNPISGGIKANTVTTGIASYKGYHKVPLDKNISIEAGEKFAVVVTFSVADDNTAAYIPFEAESGKSDGVFVRFSSSESGQSYWKFGGAEWEETSGNDSYNNVCVKAFAVPDNSLEIRTAEEFNAFAQMVANGTSFDGKNVNLMNDIDFEGGSITPVGTESNPFCGYFLGNGYVLKNGVIDSDSDMVGVFSAVSQDAAIRKLGVENISVTGVYGVGALCGINEGTLLHCYSTGSVSGEESIGGLVGINRGIISHAYSICDVTGDYNAGSLVGESDGGEDINCYVKTSSLEPIGNDTGNIIAVAEKYFANGLVAFNLDEGKSSRLYVWTERDGVTTFIRSDNEVLYEVELFSPENFSSKYVYVSSSEALAEAATQANPGYYASFYLDTKLTVPFEGALKSNIMLYVSWAEIHYCIANLTFVEAKPADCYNDGFLAYYECSCGKRYLDENAEQEANDAVIGALSHPSENVIKAEAVEATCTTDGNVEYYTCTLCNDVFADIECTILIESTVVTATGHSYGDWVTEIEPDCETDGLKAQTCSICGDRVEEIRPAVGHNYSEWVTEIEPSCETEGLKVQTCSACGDRIKEILPAIGHSYEAFVTEPTETEQGYTVYLCSTCGDNYTTDYIDPITSVNFNCVVTSYLSETDEVTVELIRRGEEEASYSLAVAGMNVSFEFENILSGAYTVRISKNNHVTREYEMIIQRGSLEAEFEINPSGDVNSDGKVNSIDVAMANAHAKGVRLLEGYQLNCADVSGDGKVNSIDVAKINAHAKSVASLWK